MRRGAVLHAAVTGSRAALGPQARGAHTLSLIMLDIDDFKVYNEAYGHLQVEVILAPVAA